MPVSNAERYVVEAITSITTQTLTDFELLVLDDCSTDGTRAAIEPLLSDPRIRLIPNVEKQGQSNLTNQGIVESRAEYVAIMHGDDIAHPDRLAKQHAEMVARPRLGILGTNAWMIDATGSIGRLIQKPATHREIQAQIFRRVPFVHPSVMFRKAVFEKIGYYQNNRRAPDFELWLRAIFQGVEGGNLQEPLLFYRVHAGQLSANRKEESRKEYELTKAAIKQYGLKVTPVDALFIYSKFFIGSYFPSRVGGMLESLGSRLLCSERKRRHAAKLR